MVSNKAKGNGVSLFNLEGTLVLTSFVSFASARRMLIHYAARPLPNEPASLGFVGVPK